MKIFLIAVILTGLLQGAYIRDIVSMTVYDTQTGLTWEDDKNRLRTWEGAVDYCQRLNFAGVRDWRLPNINELLSIVDYGQSKTTVNPAFQYLIHNGQYWSSTTSAADTASAWYINFSDGYSRTFPKSIQRYFRCVRKGKITSQNSSKTATLPAIYYLLR